jgi:hypothetical protein
MNRAASSYRPVTGQPAAGRNACSHRADIYAEKESAQKAQPADGTLTRWCCSQASANFMIARPAASQALARCPCIQGS